MEKANLEFTLSSEDFERIVDSLDQTGGYVIKEMELRYWIEYYVNRELSRQQIELLNQWQDLRYAVDVQINKQLKELANK
jgi:hypothetical protein